MSRIITLSTLFVLAAAPAMANVPGGGYEGITSLYYGTIAIMAPTTFSLRPSPPF